MKIDFGDGRVTLALVPIDMRFGYDRLANIASEKLLVDMKDPRQWLVFINRRRKIARIIHEDQKGYLIITRRLKEQSFQQLMARTVGLAREELTAEELARYLDGEEVRVKRQNFFRG